jgi:hypothetical protein
MSSRRAPALAVLGIAVAALGYGLGRSAQEPAPVPEVEQPACTDNVCGGCDGRCHDPDGRQVDHLTVRRDGHCTCTPRPGGELDRKLRAAYQRWVERARR